MKNNINNILKQEIIEYAKETSPYKAQKKYGIWSDTIKYWIDPSHRDKVKKKSKEVHSIKMKEDISYREKRRKTSQQVRATDINKKYMEQYRTDNFSIINERVKQHRLDNIDYYKQKAQDWNIKNRYNLRNRYKEDIVFKLKCNIRESIRRAVKYGKAEKESLSIKYLGCTIDEFKKYIESKFKEGMNWNNHGRGDNCWHLDHIKPLSLITECTNINLIRELCHYTNYQPLWEKDNLQKSDKI